MPILPRYVMAEVSKVFILAVTGLTMVVLIVFVAREASQQGLPLSPVVHLIPYLLPEALRVAVPVTLLLACTSVYARMSGANEVVAVKAMGISPMILLWPVFILAFMLSLLTVWFNDLAVSWGRTGVQRVVIEAVEEIVYSMLESQRRYSSPFFSINVKRVDGRVLVRPTLTIQGHGDSCTTITAEEAWLHSDHNEGVLKIFLKNGTIDVEGAKGKVTVHFTEEVREIPLSDASRAHDQGGLPSGLPMKVITEEVVRQEAAIERFDSELATKTVFQMACGDFDELTGELGQNDLEHKDLLTRLNRLFTEPHRRWSNGFSCFCFAWVGIPMAIRLRNTDFLTSFFLCFVPILVIYYPLLISATGAAKEGTLPPYSVWAGNVILIVWGAWLLRRVVRY